MPGEPVVLRGERVVLRPFRPEEIDVGASPHEGMVMDGPGARVRRRRRLERSGRLVGGWLDFAIEADGRLVGDVGARRPPGSLPPGVYELGIDVYDRGDRGKGIGREAIELLTRFLFESADAERVQATTAVGNVAMRRVFERLGFLHEGTLRGFMPIGSGREDYAMYAITREDWPGGGP